MATELEFAQKYTSLVREVCPEPVADSKLANLNGIPKFGFIKITAPQVYKRKMESNGDKEISVTFRSIRTPKFKKILSIKADWLIHKVKRSLQESLKEDNLMLDIEQIKLMLKTKTVHDGSRLSSLLKSPSDNSITLNAFITKMSAAEKAANEAANAEIPEIEATKELPQETKEETQSSQNSDKVTLSTEAWEKINEILKGEILESQLREKYLEALKKVNV